MTDKLESKIKAAIRQIGKLQITPDVLQQIEQIMRRNFLDESNPHPVSQVLTVGDIVMENSVITYTSTGESYPITRRGSYEIVFEYLMQREGEVISVDELATHAGIAHSTVNGRLADIRRNLRYRSLDVELETVEGGYILRKIGVLADPKVKNPRFKPLEVKGDVHISKEEAYIGSSTRGVYCSIDIYEWRLLKKLLEEKSVTLKTGQFEPNISARKVELMINGYSSYFVIRSTEHHPYILILEEKTKA